MKALNPIWQFFLRFRYPVSMPQDVATDLGLSISNYLTFDEFMNCLISPSYRPKNLVRFMPREDAEDIFRSALRKEKFRQNSLFSYHFKGGWMEFILEFDDQSRLRRLYMCHKNLKQKYEIPLF